MLLVACAGRHGGSPQDADLIKGQKIAMENCYVCHDNGLRSAPRVGQKAIWKPRIEKGEDELVRTVITGINRMPARGDNPDLSDDDIRLAVRYMVWLSSRK